MIVFSGSFDTGTPATFSMVVHLPERFIWRSIYWEKAAQPLICGPGLGFGRRPFRCSEPGPGDFLNVFQ